jgi:hypothetical protein
MVSAIREFHDVNRTLTLRITTAMNIYGEWDWRILAVLIIGGLIAGWMLG